ncbi:pre-16S rRNA-processing nuclease YqgF [Dendrosporobacter sp. 1207_IL3150]|uniref:pre-16S rRNA-processing nuclease YqgF n=1 Tax=Dendrosporobacter sp. 1207_IL3150 TaxID=3084054 RepID=UPI002FD9C241
MEEIVIGIDPGREKCGIAVVHRKNGVLYKNIVDTAKLVETVDECTKKYKIATAVLGAGTSSKNAVESIRAGCNNLQLVLINEYRTTDAARVRYWQENPPRGIKRLIPTSMMVPPASVDDYAAVIIAEKYLFAE